MEPIDRLELFFCFKVFATLGCLGRGMAGLVGLPVGHDRPQTTRAILFAMATLATRAGFLASSARRRGSAVSGLPTAGSEPASQWLPGPSTGAVFLNIRSEAPIAPRFWCEEPSDESTRPAM